MKFIIPANRDPKLGYYLIPQFINQSKKTYSLKNYWHSPPFPADLMLKREGPWLCFDIGNLQEIPLGFKLKRDGTVDDWYCFENDCVSQVKVLNAETIYVILGNKEYKFINVENYKSTDGPCDLDPCE